MSLSAQVNKAVEMAFKAAGDLIKTGSLFKVTSASFNFITGGVSTPLPASIAIDILDVTTKSKEVTTNEVIKDFLLRTKQVQSLTTLDYIVIGTEKWQIRDVNFSNGFTSSVKVMKGSL